MKRILKYITIYLACIALPMSITAQAQEPDSLSVELDEVTVTRRDPGLKKLRGTAFNTEVISAGELARAACCNLGESFTTNPSVDVNYNDAATGARQIKLLGLSGTYVQMLTENIPNFRGSALPYGLGYIPGPWLQSIQVSKGASSVKNGYESITGQINIEMKKPQADQELALNGYADINAKAELNASGNIHLDKHLSTALLLHGENSFESHDHNSDGFMDMPRLKQINAINRWAWMGTNYVFQAGVKFLSEERRSGQDAGHSHSYSHQSPSTEPYRILIHTNRWEVFTKNAYIFDKANDGNIALILSGSSNDFRSSYGHKIYDVDQTNGYASLMFERKFGERHSLSTGLSFNYDHYSQGMRLTHDLSTAKQRSKEIEAVGGAYAQYTYNLSSRLLLMGGIRYDYSSMYGSMVTPRFHGRWNIAEALTLHGSVGRGFRTPHVMAENNFLLASSRNIVIDPDIDREEVWNLGIGTGSILYIASKPLNFNTEYYYTDFHHQLITDFDSDPSAVHFRNLNGQSYSHTLQIDATYPFFPDFSFTAAYRFTKTRIDYGHGMTDKPLTSRNKGLFTASNAPMMGLWQFDITCSITGGGRMPSPPLGADGAPAWSSRYNAFAQLNAQVTRNFRHWAIYAGGENLTGYRQKKPIVGAENPWGTGFDATMVYAPLHGALIYMGVRYTLTKY